VARVCKLGTTDELACGCADVDQDDVAGRQRVAVRLISVDVPRPALQELTNQPALLRRSVEDVVGQARSLASPPKEVG
jgi:hypothetical protein